jgi:Peptidase family M28/Carboxypeptidase regulatory-like domain
MKTHARWVRRLLSAALCILALASQPATAFTYMQDDDQLSPALATSTQTPLTAPTPEALAASQAFVPNPAVAAMMAQVRQDTVYTYTGDLSGEWPALVGGVPYTITTRNTDSGMPIQMATQYVYEHMQASGLAVSYHNWDTYWHANRNVVGVFTGTTQPDEIVLITAHLDNMPSSGLAPGADDNASGSVGVLVAAEILSQYQFERTLRFVFFTGEEQWLLGSAQYAQAVHAAGDNIVGVYNMDMIAWDDTDGPTLRLHTRSPSNSGYPGDLAIAGVFTNVVNAYGLDDYLTPIIDADGISASDHASFWDNGYSAILAIEDDEGDFNNYYHSQNDRLQILDADYYVNYVKASVGTAAHLACPLLTTGILTGVIADEDSLAPIAGAQVQAKSGVCPPHSGTSDSMGTYTLTLPVGVYSATASASGYWPRIIPGVIVTSTTPSTLDILLKPVKTIYMPIVFKDSA